MTRGTWHMNLEHLHKLKEGLKHRPCIQVGVFQKKNARKEEGMTNATLAAIHEFGAPEHGLPARSVLKVPISEHAKEIMQSVKGKADMIVKARDIKSLWSLVGIAAEKVISKAFDTGGYGKWAPLRYETLMKKLNIGKFRNLHRRKLTIAHIFAGNIGMGILIDRGELRKSYLSRVVMKL